MQTNNLHVLLVLVVNHVFYYGVCHRVAPIIDLIGNLSASDADHMAAELSAAFVFLFLSRPHSVNCPVWRCQCGRSCRLGPDWDQVLPTLCVWLQPCCAPVGPFPHLSKSGIRPQGNNVTWGQGSLLIAIVPSETFVPRRDLKEIQRLDLLGVVGAHFCMIAGGVRRTLSWSTAGLSRGRWSSMVIPPE